MKKITTLAVFVLVACFSHGQINYGISGGINFSSVPKESLDFDEYQISTIDDYYTGFHIGFMSQISVLGIFIQPELLFTSIGNDMKIERRIGEEGVEYYSRKIRRIDLPVLAGTKLGPVRVGVGPVGSFIIGESSDFDFKKEIPESKEEMNNMAVGFQVGLGVNISNLVLDVKYENAITKLGDVIVIGQEKKSFDSRPRQFIISIGVLL